MEKKESKEVKAKDNKMIIIVIILFIIVIAMGIYIAYDKGVIFSKVEKETKESEKKTKEKDDEEDVDDKEDEIKPLDITNCLNSEKIYSNASDVSGDYGLSMNINSDLKSITLSIDWNKFGPLSNATAWANTVEDLQIIGFNKDVKEAFVGDLGQSSVGITMFFLMSDGTVEYMPMFNRKFDSQNNLYYEMNYTQEYSADNRITGKHFETKGALPNIENVIKLYVTDAAVQNSAGARTTIGAKADGSFYDLGVSISQ